MTKSILIIGGTGAQGAPVVKLLSSTGLYEIRCLTRDTTSSQAQELGTLPRVKLFEGAFDDSSLQSALDGMDLVWVNTNGFALGEQAETFWSIRIYQLSVRAGVQHLVYSALDPVYKKSGYDPKYRIGHYEGKARVSEYLAAQPTEPTAWTVVDAGPYMEMLFEALAPSKDENGGYVFALPLGPSGAMPMIYVPDLARYTHWAFQNPSESTGLRLSISTAHVSGQDIATAFSAVTGKSAKYVDVPTAAWLQAAFGRLPDGPDTKVGYRTAHDSALTQTYRENFTAWWEVYKASGGNQGLLTKDYALLDRILPDRVKSVEDWMRIVGYTGERKSVLKDVEDQRRGQ